MFKKTAGDVAEQIGALLGKADAKDVQAVLDALDVSDLVVLSGDYQDLYEAVAKDGGLQALAQIGITDDKMLEVVNEAAVKWAAEAGAEMVGKKLLEDGTLIDNPDPRWRIDESTREMLRATVSDALDSGMSNQNLAATIKEAYAFSAERALLIARTETAFADVQGNLIAYKQAGVKKKQWITAAGCCELCAVINGKVVKMNEAFVDSVMAPPYHPRCRCDVLPVIDEGKN